MRTPRLASTPLTAPPRTPGGSPRILAVLLLIGFSVWGCTAGNDVKPREGGIEGKVYNKAGAALDKVLVSWVYDRTRWGQSDATGQFHVEGVGFGDQTFIAELPGYRSKTFYAPVYSGSITTIEQVVMETSSFDYRDIKVDEYSATHAVISWKTTDYTSGVVEYGDTESMGRTVRETADIYATTHQIQLTDLKPQTRYSFRIVASRQNQSSETSPTQTFSTLTTLEDSTVPSSPKGIGAGITEALNQVTIYWAPNTDSDLKGYKIYRSDSPLAAFSAIDNVLIAKGQERFTDVNVVPGRKYYYRVSAVDQGGNESGPSEIVNMVIPGIISQEVVWTRANSPYQLTGDLEIAEIGLLRIDPGVTVELADYDALRRNDAGKVEIRVTGGFIASAGNDVGILFTSSRGTPAAGDWGGITFLNNATGGAALVNVTVAYANQGLTLNNANGVFADIRLMNCNIGVSGKQNTGLTLASVSPLLCPVGMELSEGTNLTVIGSTFYHNRRGIVSSQHEGATFQANDFLEYVEFGLSSSERAGQISIRDNLFVSPVGVGLRLGEYVTDTEYNTFDSAYGIRIDRGDHTVIKNILVADHSLTGVGFGGIEHLAGAEPLPVIGPNDVVGFATGKDYIGCASATGSLAEKPLFMKDFSTDPYDYRLRQPFPNSTDQWGMQRQE